MGAKDWRRCQTPKAPLRPAGSDPLSSSPIGSDPLRGRLNSPPPNVFATVLNAAAAAERVRPFPPNVRGCSRGSGDSWSVKGQTPRGCGGASRVCCGWAAAMVRRRAVDRGQTPRALLRPDGSDRNPLRPTRSDPLSSSPTGSDPLRRTPEITAVQLPPPPHQPRQPRRNGSDPFHETSEGVAAALEIRGAAMVRPLAGAAGHRGFAVGGRRQWFAGEPLIGVRPRGRCCAPIGSDPLRGRSNSPLPNVSATVLNAAAAAERVRPFPPNVRGCSRGSGDSWSGKGQTPRGCSGASRVAAGGRRRWFAGEPLIGVRPLRRPLRPDGPDRNHPPHPTRVGPTKQQPDRVGPTSPNARNHHGPASPPLHQPRQPQRNGSDPFHPNSGWIRFRGAV